MNEFIPNRYYLRIDKTDYIIPQTMLIGNKNPLSKIENEIIERLEEIEEGLGNRNFFKKRKLYNGN